MTNAQLTAMDRTDRPTADEITKALAAWGSFDRDNPFPLFTALLEQGPVHAVTLADGRDLRVVSKGHYEVHDGSLTLESHDHEAI